MNVEGTYKKLQRLVSQNLLLKIGFIALVIVTFLNYQSIETIKKQEKTLVIPMGLHSPYWVGDADADDKYLNYMGRLVASLYQNLTGATVQYQHRILLGMVHPSQFEPMRKKFMNIQKEVQKSPRHAFYFKPIGLQIDRDGQRLILKGHRVRYFSDGIKPEVPIRIVVDYVIEQGRFFVMDVNDPLIEPGKTILEEKPAVKEAKAEINARAAGSEDEE